jgi:hypothetical protein
MTTKAADTSSDIAINLEEDPELNILAWRLKVQEVASSLATSVAPTGLLTHILDDTEWNAHPANVCNTLVKIRNWGTPGKYFS